MKFMDSRYALLINLWIWFWEKVLYRKPGALSQWGWPGFDFRSPNSRNIRRLNDGFAPQTVGTSYQNHGFHGLAGRHRGRGIVWYRESSKQKNPKRPSWHHWNKVIWGYSCYLVNAISKWASGRWRFQWWRWIPMFEVIDFLLVPSKKKLCSFQILLVYLVYLFAWMYMKPSKTSDKVQSEW